MEGEKSAKKKVGETPLCIKLSASSLCVFCVVAFILGAVMVALGVRTREAKN